MTQKILTGHIGMMIVDLINDHTAACEDDETPSFHHGDDPEHPLPAATFDTCDVHAPGGDYSNVEIMLPNGQAFRVSVVAIA